MDNQIINLVEEKQKLIEKTQNLLNATVLTASQIEKLSGVKASWIKKFQDNQFDNPGLEKIQQVYNCLQKVNI